MLSLGFVGLSLIACTSSMEAPLEGESPMSIVPGQGTPDPGHVHTAAAGCQPDYVACGATCAKTQDDSRHCGACDKGCAYEAGCEDGACKMGLGCLGTKVLCAGVCRQTSSDANHCGSCDNRCADAALCADSACIAGGGDGSRCDKPLFWNNEDHERVGFRMSAALSSLHTFVCGPLEAIPTRYFRFTATKEKTDIEVYSDKLDDYILEVFTDGKCAPSSSTACNDDGRAPDPQLQNLPTQVGKTYYIAVGLKNAATWSGRSVTMKIDH